MLALAGALESGNKELELIEFSLGSSLVEELTLMAVETISTMNFPLEIICCYLRSCPQLSLPFATFTQTLLPRRVVQSDKEAFQISSMLRSMGFEGEARVVEVCRGLWWLQKRQAVTKALLFFIRAGDYSRVSCICERATWKVCVKSITTILSFSTSTRTQIA